MRNRVGMAIGAVLLAATVLADEPKTPNLDGVVSLYGRFAALAHGCPVGENLILTGAHVTDIFPSELNMPLFGYRFESAYDAGLLIPDAVYSSADLALAHADTPLHFWYQIATEAPKPGDYVWFVGYSWKNRKEVLSRTATRSKVVRSMAGSLSYEPAGVPGSSGSCVLNEKGEVVAINVGRLVLEDRSAVGIGVAVWPPWFEVPKDKE